VCIHNDNQRGCDSREQHEMVLLFFFFSFHLYMYKYGEEDVLQGERTQLSSMTSRVRQHPARAHKQSRSSSHSLL